MTRCIYEHKGEIIKCHITPEFDSNHILHMTSSKRGELNVWWGYDVPPIEEVLKLYDRHRGEVK